MYRILVTGSRDWPVDKIDIIIKAMNDTVSEILCEGAVASDIILVHGGCPKGADAMADWIARSWALTVEVHKADWNSYGKAAGFIRNKQMVDLGAYKCLAFRYNKSNGTSHTINLCKEVGVPVDLFDE